MIPIKDNIPTDRFPLVTVGLILANVVVYLLSLGHVGALISGPATHELVRYGATPFALTHPGAHAPGGLPAWETALTGMFIHASIIQLAGNMLFLWIFGNTVEDAMGPVRFLAFYIAGGLIALGLQTAIDPNSPAATVGAAGPIAAVLGGYVVLHPRARALTLVLIPFFFGVIELPVLVMLAIWFALQAVFGAAGLTTPSGGGGGVAYLAHVAGFVFGLLAIRLLAGRRKPAPPTMAAFR